MNAKGCGLTLLLVGAVVFVLSIAFCKRDQNKSSEARQKSYQEKLARQQFFDEIRQHFARAQSLFASDLYVKASAEFSAAYDKLESRDQLGATNYGQLTTAIVNAICAGDFTLSEKLSRLYLSKIDLKDRDAQYFPLFASLSFYASGNSGEAMRVAKVATQGLDASSWPYPIAMYLAREISTDELLRMAGNNRDNLMAANCHIAFRESAEGKPERAVEAISAALKNGNKRYLEFRIADAHADNFSKAATFRLQRSTAVDSDLPRSSDSDSGKAVAPKIDPLIATSTPNESLPDPSESYSEAERIFEVRNWATASAEYIKAFRQIGDRTPEAIRYRIAECALLAGDRELADLITSTQQPRATHEKLFYSINIYVLSTMLGDPERSRSILKDAKTKAESDYWPFPVLDFCLGERDFKDLINDERFSVDRRNFVKMIFGFNLLAKSDWKGGLSSFYEGSRGLSEAPGLQYAEHPIHVAAVRAYHLVRNQRIASGELKQPTNADFSAAIQKVRFFRHSQFPKLHITRVGFKRIEYCGGNKFSVDAELDWESDERYSSGKAMGWGTEYFRYEFELDNTWAILGGKIVKSGR
jgi:hypothetical protein